MSFVLSKLVVHSVRLVLALGSSGVPALARLEREGVAPYCGQMPTGNGEWLVPPSRRDLYADCSGPNSGVN